MKISTSLGSALIVSIFLFFLVSITFSHQQLNRTYNSLLSIASHTQLAQLSGSGSGLVAHYTFDEGSGTTAGDSAGSNTGTLVNGPTWGSGKIGGGLEFDGVDDYITFASSPTPGSEMTVSTWVYKSADGILVYRGSSACCLSYHLKITSGKARFAIVTTSGSNPDIEIISNASIPDNTWTLVTATYSSSNSNLSLYINGTFDTSGSYTGTIYNSVVTMNIGAQNTPSSFLTGTLDDIRIYSRALTPSEVSDLYAYTGGTTTPTPVNGSCSTTVNQCTTGSLTDTADTSTNYQWQCTGSNGGSTASCSLPIPPPSTDTTPPTISSIQSSSLTTTGATISWTTNESSDTQIEYGLTTSYGSNTTLNASLLTSHTQSLTGLTANTTYHYRVKSKDAANNLTTSSNQTFTTTATPVTSTSGTYYIDFDSGSDTNSGAMSSPWKHAPGDANATGVAAATTLQGGKTVRFKGGVSYVGGVEVKWSGSSGNPIVYDGNSDGSWGSGKAIITGQNNPQYIYGFLASNAQNYVTIDNFEITDFGGYVDSSPVFSNGSCTLPVSIVPKGIGISFFNGGTDLVFSNLYIHEMGVWQNQAPFNANALDSGAGIVLQNNRRVTIDAVEITKTNKAISVKSTISISDIEIKNVDIHNYVAWGIDVAPRAANAEIENIRIHDSRFHDYQEYDLENWKGCGGRPHSDAIFLRRDYHGIRQLTPIKIYNNAFYNVNQSGGGTAAIHATEGPSVEIYNNIFTNTVHGRTIYLHNGPGVGDSPQVIRILNNTFYNDHTAINIQGSPVFGPIYIKNNIFYDTRINDGNNFAIYIEDPGLTITELDYNIYRSLNFANVLIRSADWGELSMAALKARGFEAHGILVDPLFKNITYGLGSQVLSNDLTLQVSSPAINAGANLSSYFTTDILGTPRGSTWDIGAYEYQGATTPPTTYSVTATKSGTGSGTLTGTGLSCTSNTCVASVANSSSITLTATPSTGSTFTGWSNGCTGTSTCTLSSAASVTATFTLIPDTTLPTITLTSPSGTISSTVTLSATASDNVGVTSVQFLIDGSLISTLTTAPYSGSWNTVGISNGTHTLTAIAKDAANNTRTSNPVTITVLNTVTTPPVPSTPPPTTGTTGAFTGVTTGGAGTTGSGSSSTGTFTPTVTQTPLVHTGGTTLSPYAGLSLLLRNLYRGLTGEDVRTLQRFLTIEGLLTIDIPTTYFGILTETAVKAFQSKNSIVSSGTPYTTGYGSVGPKTRAVINAKIGNTTVTPVITSTNVPITTTLTYNMTDPQVSTLQSYLISKGYLTSQPTGYFGDLTLAAVKKFQCEKLSICSGTADTNGYGAVGPRTRAVLK